MDVDYPGKSRGLKKIHQKIFTGIQIEKITLYIYFAELQLTSHQMFFYFCGILGGLLAVKCIAQTVQ